MKTLLSIIIPIAIAITSAPAAEKKKKGEVALPDVKVSDFKVGEVVSGAAVDFTNTGGKAVVIEAWGVRCGPCIASLPHMETLAKRNKADTIIVGAESQGSSSEDISAVVKKFKLSYTITKGGLQTPAGVGSGSIPHAYVFDTTGKLIFSGHPGASEFEKAVRKAGRPAPAAK